MAENTQENASMTNAAAEFMKAIENKASNDELKTLLDKTPNLLSSEAFAKQVFPKVGDAKNMGLVPLDKMVDTIKKVKELADNGLISAEQSKDFMSMKDPRSGENFATFAAKQAVSAYDKANTDRSPEPNLSDEGKNIFQQQQQLYSNQIEEMKNLGVPMNLPNEKGQTLDSIAKSGKNNNANGNSPALSVNIDDNNGLEVGGGEPKPLKVEVNDKPALKVKVDTKPKEKEEDQNEATVEDAPEEDKPKGSGLSPEAVKEEDIIQYMYREWFLASLSWSINELGDKIYSGVSALCDSYVKQSNKPTNKNLSNKAQKFQKSGATFLKAMPTQMRNQFEASLNDKNNYMSTLNKDILDNVGKKPQQWKSLDANVPSNKALIDTINASYQKDPTGFVQQLKDMEKNSKSVKNFTLRVYDLSVQQATAQYMLQQMDKKNPKDFDINDKKVQKEIAKLAQKNFASNMSGIKAISEHAKYELKLNQGVTDPTKIKDAEAQAISNFLKGSEMLTAKTMASITDDLKTGDFKSAGKSISQETKDNARAMEKLMSDGEKHWEYLVPNKRKNAGLEGPDEIAKKMNTQDIIQNSAYANVSNDIKSVAAQIDANKKRRANFKQNTQQYESELNNSSKFKNYKQQSTKDSLHSMIYSNKGNGRQ